MKTRISGVLCLSILMAVSVFAAQQEEVAVPFGAEPVLQADVPAIIDYGIVETYRTGGIQAACDRIVDSMCAAECGGMGIPWPLPPCPAPASVPGNTFGPAGIGMLHGYSFTGDFDHIVAAFEFGDYGRCFSYPSSQGGQPRFASHTPFFLWLITEMMPAATQYRTYAQVEYFDALQNGTFGRTDTGPWNTQEYLDLMWNARSDTQRNIRSYDFANLPLAFREMGSSGQFDLAIDHAKAAFDNVRDTHSWSVLGPAAAIAGLATANVDYEPQDPEMPMYGQPDLYACVEHLLNAQTPCGGFSWFWTWGDWYPGTYSAEWLSGGQVTAYALLAMKAVDPWHFADEIQAAEDFLYSLQLPNGGFAGYYGDDEEPGVPGEPDPTTENLQVVGEIVGALVFEPTPWNSGDVNSDGSMTPGDAQGAFQMYLNMPPYENPRYWQFNAADCDGDGRVTPGDALSVWAQYLGYPGYSCADPIDPGESWTDAMIPVSDRTDHLSVSGGNLFVTNRVDSGMQVIDITINSSREVNAFGFKIVLPEFARFYSFDFGPAFSEWEFHGTNLVDHTVIIGGFDLDNPLTGQTFVGSLKLTPKTHTDKLPVVITDLVDDIADFVIK
jgi:hypothetical protein